MVCIVGGGGGGEWRRADEVNDSGGISMTGQ